MHLTHLNVVTRDLPRALAFYTEVLDFEYVQTLRPGKVVLDANGFDFFLEQADAVHLNPKFHIGFKVDYEALVAFGEKLARLGVPLVHGNNPEPTIYTEPDGVRSALYFEDPDGYLIELYTAV